MAGHYNGFTPAQRAKAFRWFKGEIEAGQRPAKPTRCEVCGQLEGSLMWHSEDYSEPYGPHIGEHGLCFRCHMAIHCRFRNRAAWAAYREAIEQGRQFRPVAHFPTFIEQFDAKHAGVFYLPVAASLPGWFSNLDAETRR